jgi:hypothetical protein
LAVTRGAKEKASREFACQEYASALLTSTRAIDAAQYVNRKSGSSSSILQLNVVTLMVACSIRAAACCQKLDQSNEAETIARDALVIIGNTLEPKLDGSIRTHVSNNTDHGYNRVFGEWRVKNLLVLARVSIEQQDYEQALQVLDNARAVSTTYATSECTRTVPLETSRPYSVSNDVPKDKRISVTMCEVLCESERKEEELSGSPWVDIGDDDSDDDVNLVSPETSDAIKRIAALLVKETARKRNRREKLVHETEKPNIPQERKSAVKITPLSLAQEGSVEQQQENGVSHSSPESPLCVNSDIREENYFDPSSPLSREAKNAVNPQEGTNDEEKKGNLDTRPPSLVVGDTAKVTSPPTPIKISPDRTEEAHQSHSILESSPRMIKDEVSVREESESQLQETAPPLRGKSSQERKKFEQRMHDILGVSPRVAVDDGKEEEGFDQDAKSVARSSVKMSPPFFGKK